MVRVNKVAAPADILADCKVWQAEYAEATQLMVKYWR